MSAIFLIIKRSLILSGVADVEGSEIEVQILRTAVTIGQTSNECQAGDSLGAGASCTDSHQKNIERIGATAIQSLRNAKPGSDLPSGKRHGNQD